MKPAERCETCKHWRHPLETFATIVELDWQAHPRDGDRDEISTAYDSQYGECEAAEFMPREQEYPTPESAPAMIVQDGSGYQATLFTKVDFGCTEWEPK